MPDVGLQRPLRGVGVRLDAKDFELDERELESLGTGIDIASVNPELMKIARETHALEVAGLEHVASAGPQVLIGNLCYTLSSYEGIHLSEHSVIVLHVLSNHLSRPARLLASRRYYMPAERARRCAQTYRRLGYVPATISNGVRLLTLGESVTMFPEGYASKPPYELRPFHWGFARMAWIADAPVVPFVFTGSREARPHVERGGNLLPIAPHRRFPVPYRLEFLPPVHPRAAIETVEDARAVSEFCDGLRQRMQSAINDIVVGRRSYEIALDLQQRLGT